MLIQILNKLWISNCPPSTHVMLKMVLNLKIYTVTFLDYFSDKYIYISN